MITEWIYHNQALELHVEQGLLCSWLADTTKHGYLASLLNRFPAIGSQMAQLIRTNPAIERARATSTLPSKPQSIRPLTAIKVRHRNVMTPRSSAVSPAPT
jgi:hypothetical protein